MTASNLFGQSLSLTKIERCVMAHTKLWLPTYLREAERAEQYLPDGSANTVGQLPLPRSYRPTDGRVDKWPEDQLPALIFGTSGVEDGSLRHQGNGEYTARWIYQLTVVHSAKDDVLTRYGVGVYAAALLQLFAQQQKISGLDVEGIVPLDLAYDRLAFSPSRALGSASLLFSLEAGTVADARGGPSEPLVDPESDPGPAPEVTTVQHDITKKVS